jgi:hypothetical protein
MSSTSQPAQEQRLANLVALHRSLKEMAAKTTLAAPTARERAVVLQGLVLTVRGK